MACKEKHRRGERSITHTRETDGLPKGRISKIIEVDLNRRSLLLLFERSVGPGCKIAVGNHVQLCCAADTAAATATATAVGARTGRR